MSIAFCCSVKQLASLDLSLLKQLKDTLGIQGNLPWVFVFGDEQELIDDQLVPLLSAKEYRNYSSVDALKKHSIYASLVGALVARYGFSDFVCCTEDTFLTEHLTAGTAYAGLPQLNQYPAVGYASASDFIGELCKNRLDDVDVAQLSKAVADIFTEGDNYLYVDISTLVHFDHATGIQRVVKELSTQLMALELSVDCRFIYSYPQHNHFYHIVSIDAPVLPYEAMEDAIVDFTEGDKILFLDLHPSNAYTKNAVIHQLQLRGVESYFVVYDLLPNSHPHCFVQELVDDFQLWLATVARSSGAVCISNDVSHKLDEWIASTGSYRYPHLTNTFFHLGADFDTSKKMDQARPDQADAVEAHINNPNQQVFLMVGTIEPRKGHKDVLDAFDDIWALDSDSTLLIVGKAGWRNESFIDRMQHHPQLGKRLFWLQGLSDGYLDYLYQKSDCLIAASEGEGFGLPLIEAAQYGLPIIARDIPVFREVAGDHASYFFNKLELLNLIKSKDYESSEKIKHLSWNESALKLIEIVLNDD
jgi:glycosyltransferase involved in cell wall biosynthesis